MKSTLYWFPRILAIIVILIMLLFSFDSFEGSEPLARKLLGFFMHNIPVLVLTAILIVAWSREMIGGMLFIMASLAGTIFFRIFSGNFGAVIIVIPIMLTGIMFIYHSIRYAKGDKA